MAIRGGAVKAMGLLPTWTSLVLLAGPIVASGGDTEPRWLGGQIYEENDSILLADGDQRYSQGFRIAISRNPAHPLCRNKKGKDCLLTLIEEGLKGWLLSEDRSYVGGLSIILGQNLYTPRIITAPVPEPADRAFSGYLYLGGQASFTSKGELERHTLEVDIGLFGKEALGQGAQAGLHVLRHHRIPKGWGEQEPEHGVGFLASYRFEQRLPLLKVHGASDKERVLLDATVGYLGHAGNVRTAFGLHGAARAGWALTGFPASTIQMSARGDGKPFFEIGGLAGYEIRSIFNTSLVRATEGTTTDFSHEPLVWDWRFGGYVRTGAFRLTYQKVTRSPEFSIVGVPRRDQEFSSIAISYEPDLSKPRGSPPAATPLVAAAEKPAAGAIGWSRLYKHFEIELGMGRNFLGPEIATGSPRGHAGHFAVRKWIWKGFNVGLLDFGGVSVETVPARPGERFHTDLFLTQNALSLGWKPRGPEGALALRIGYPLWGGTAKLERVTNPPDESGLLTEQIDEREVETAKRGLLLGVQFFLRVEKHLALGIDVAYQRMELPNASALVSSPDFVTAVIAAQIRP